MPRLFGYVCMCLSLHWLFVQSRRSFKIGAVTWSKHKKVKHCRLVIRSVISSQSKLSCVVILTFVLCLFHVVAAAFESLLLSGSQAYFPATTSKALLVSAPRIFTFLICLFTLEFQSYPPTSRTSEKDCLHNAHFC